MDEVKSYSTEDIDKLKQRIVFYRESLTQLKTGLSIEDFLTIKENFNMPETENLIEAMKNLKEETDFNIDEQSQKKALAPLGKKIDSLYKEELKTETPSYVQMQQITSRIQRPKIPNNLISILQNEQQNEQTYDRPRLKPTFPYIDAFSNRIDSGQNDELTFPQSSKTKKPNINIAIPMNRVEVTEHIQKPPVKIETKVKVDNESENDQVISAPTKEASINQSNDNDFFSRFNIFRKRKKE